MKRYNRVQFVFSQVLIISLFLISIMMATYIKLLPMSWKGWYLIILFIAAFGITIRAIIKRLHDMNLSGYWVFAAILLSLIGKLFPDVVMSSIDTGIIIFFSLIPGNKVENKYGHPSKKRWGFC